MDSLFSERIIHILKSLSKLTRKIAPNGAILRLCHETTIIAVYSPRQSYFPAKVTTGPLWNAPWVVRIPSIAHRPEPMQAVVILLAVNIQ